MDETPVLHRVGGGTAAGFDVGQNFDRGGDAGGRSHHGIGLWLMGFGARLEARRQPR